MLLRLGFEPMTVSFGRTLYREIGHAGSNGTGDYANGNEPYHDAGGGPGQPGLGLPIGDDNLAEAGFVDQAMTFRGPVAGWMDATWDWEVPGEYSCVSDATWRRLPFTNLQDFMLVSFIAPVNSGYGRVRKSGQVAERFTPIP
ncbi:MAG: hypothetical protein PF961_22450, partial [Planctomycetota bacterium]|jgi:hypothetical protein|nr:hypothetical protein [Planctomycetota bacterium]